MTDKELVERLRLNANCMMDEWEPTLCKRSEFITAADRIEQLCAELYFEKIDNTNLIGELATVAAERDRYKAERDAFMKTVHGNCGLCKHGGDNSLDEKSPCWHCEKFACKEHVTGNYWELCGLEGNA